MTGPVKLAWQCTFCGLDLEGNPRMCPRCSYTVYRPVIAPPGDEQVPVTVSAVAAAQQVDRPDARRERARVAYRDSRQEWPELDALEIALETATRTKVTDAVLTAAYQAWGYGRPADVEDLRDSIEAAFTAAGFEVEK